MGQKVTNGAEHFGLRVLIKGVYLASYLYINLKWNPCMASQLISAIRVCSTDLVIWVCYLSNLTRCNLHDLKK